MIFPVLLALTLSLPAQSADVPVKIHAGERIAFLGDSISVPSAGSWTVLVESAIRARMPGAGIKFLNRARAGERLWDATERMESDLGPWKPTLIFTCLGMNDAVIYPTTPTSTTEFAASLRQQAAIAKKMGARLVYLTPPRYNIEAAELSPVLAYLHPDGTNRDMSWATKRVDINATLAGYSGVIHQVGAETGNPVLDFFQPMKDSITRSGNKAYMASMSPDAIHPSLSGNLFLALAVLDRLDIPPLSVHISGPSTGPVRAGVDTLSRIKITPQRMDFTVRLPFVPLYCHPAAWLALLLYKGEANFNGFTLSISGWETERCVAMLVDNRPVTNFSGASLAEGINLNTVNQAPWCIRGKAIADAVLLSSDYEEWSASVSGKEIPAPLSSHPPDPDSFAGPVSYRITLEPEGP